MPEDDYGLLPSLSPASAHPLEGLDTEATGAGLGDEVQQDNAIVQTDPANIGENDTNTATIDAHIPENALNILSDNSTANDTDAASIEEVFTQFIQEYENLSVEGQHLRDQVETLNTVLHSLIEERDTLSEAYFGSMAQNVDLMQQMQNLNGRLEAAQGLSRAMQFLLARDGELLPLPSELPEPEPEL